ncbi:uncharacterized protein B0H18DRAFT_1213605 [Fomitopsis serialis]|uniref:uncharacterized protein n=1 Tax=Fomitopsis serialis TaxID=139415 RepID=UPI002008826F|nr:uncharacterized protein B0H18DRAFT_1213605 [Neoantrodia serialis]KAH9919930.1 hypothetical protein B0H18DRAFT_1213605 [Neoantrodia serialis]
MTSTQPPLYLSVPSTNIVRRCNVMADEEEVALFFASCMKDPARPTHCARVLCSCLQILDGSEPYEPSALYRPYLVPQNKDYEDIRRIYSEGLNTSVAFLTLPRSNKETEDLDAFLSTCSCSFSPAKNATEARLLLWLHAFEAARRLTLRDLTEALIRHLGGVLNHAVESRTVGGTTVMGGLAKHRKKHAGKPLWPTDPSQLIPYSALP